MLTVISVGASFLAYGVSIWLKAEHPFPYYVIMLIFIFLYGFFAYLFGDLEYLRYKKEVGEMRPTLPEEEKEKILNKRLPFIISLIINIIILGVFFIISLFMKRWPLL
jgi:hypothetical protein